MLHTSTDTRQSPIDQAVAAFLHDRTTDFELLDRLGDSDCSEELPNPMEYLERLRDLLAINLLIRCSQSQAKYRIGVGSQIRQLASRGLWKEFQPASALLQLNAHLAGVSCPVEPPTLSTGGAAPLDYADRWSWSGVPLQPFHAELGALWALYGCAVQNKDYLEAAERIAEWQLNLLDADGSPLVGILSQDADIPLVNTLVANAILYRAIAWATGKAAYHSLAVRQRELAQELIEKLNAQFPGWAAMAWHWIDLHNDAKAAPWQSALPEIICDPATGLVGHRSRPITSVSVLSGGRSGMGMFRTGDVEIVAFGPQWLPLDRLEGFGIEAPMSELNQPHSDVAVTTNGTEYQIQGRTRLSPKPPKAPSVVNYREGGHSGTWLAFRQDYQLGALTLRTAFTSLASLDELAFCFYVKASGCRVGNKTTITRRSLDRYQGAVASVELAGELGSVVISGFPGKGELQVIPLPGDSHYWGADYIVAYVLDPKHFHYFWKLNAT